jgi:predicted dehydrogenase
MAPTAEACRNIVAAVKEAGVMMAVCHVLRYTSYTSVIKKLIDDGEIGEIMTIQHLEPLGYWHHAHSYVRGNWRNEAESSPMLLAKSCHDVDWLRGIMGKKCTAVHSFGTLRHFKASEKPAGAADRCMDCPVAVESKCPYSAIKVYFRDRFCKGHKVWPVNVLTPEVTDETLTEAFKNGPYGRCVYHCDNNVVDHQVVNLEMTDGTTMSFNMCGFTADIARSAKFMGTKGELIVNMVNRVLERNNIVVREFNPDVTETVIYAKDLSDDFSGHGGGDNVMVEEFIDVLSGAKEESPYVTSLEMSMESHFCALAAEQSRLEGGKVIQLDEFRK